MARNLDIVDAMNMLGTELNAARAFIDTLEDKADYFAKLCTDTANKLYKAEQHYKKLQKALKSEQK